MTDSIIILLVLILQLLTVYLDNKCNIYDFFSLVARGNVASAYSNRGITLTVSRTIFYAVPPILGYIIINATQKEMEFLLITVASLNLTITVIQVYIYNQRFKFGLMNELHRLKYLLKKMEFYVGILAFIFFLITPYLLNYLAVLFTHSALWLVQLNPIINAFLTLYVIWLFEPRISKKIDKQHDYKDELFEAMFVRVCGRLITFFTVLFFLGVKYYASG